MEKEIRENIELLFKKHPELTNIGYKTQQSIFQKFRRKVRKKIPGWYDELLTEYPIAELKIGIPFNFGWESLKNKNQSELPYMNTEFNSIENIESIAKEEFPGAELIKQNYICIAENTNKDGDGFYINSKEQNPTVIYIYHDCGSNASELIKNGQVISSSFSEFLNIIKPHEFADKWLDENEHLWK
ncbi:SMI1/KNR4 family protein [Tenacibaculum sp. M341]|uniref:SMI1/KNR4 family protein n=1 Tax=Tenacibaculum sp. M341 TaxID=2530339 RepID=UPI0010457C1B|nr:SMI1/KNR4 family protein [Tenacibaculum sp. M341]TCI93732.1 hypothetical protein EYW44_04765 [Tenacibaculum sp. M341]